MGLVLFRSCFVFRGRFATKIKDSVQWILVVLAGKLGLGRGLPCLFCSFCSAFVFRDESFSYRSVDFGDFGGEIGTRAGCCCCRYFFFVIRVESFGFGSLDVGDFGLDWA